MAQEGENSTVLIHEATLTSNRKKEAIKKNHTTIQEAVEIAQKMKAQRLILTHFSQRYTISHKKYGTMFRPENENVKEVSDFIKESCIFAFDHLKIPFKDLQNFPMISQIMNYFVIDDEQNSTNAIKDIIDA